MQRFRPTKTTQNIGLAILMIGGLFLLYVAIVSKPHPTKRSFNYGFGRGWSCYNQGSMEPTCIFK